MNPRGWYKLAGPDESVIGYEFLARFTVRIDYPRRRLWLKRRRGGRPTFQGHAYDGLADLLEKLEGASR